MSKSTSGFTIVELLIVIVVVAVLAAITYVGFTSIQGRARDSHRLASIRGITQSLERYRLFNGRYPSPTSASGSWERSDTEPTANFMEYLANYGFGGGTPVDPSNTSQYNFHYYRYGAGNYGCDPARGAYYVFGIKSFESVSGTHPNSPGFSCTSRNWQNEFSWVTGVYEN